MAARAFSSQKPALQHSSRATVTRAAHDSSQSSGTDSPDSGRLRRRRGKLKMQARIVELEGRVHTLLEVIHQLTSSPADVSCRIAAIPPEALGHTSSTEIFDLFADGTSFTDAMVQTDISVDWNRPDIFIQVPQQGLECQPSLSLDAPLSEVSVAESGALPQCAAGIHHSSQGTAHADAAAGHEAAHGTFNRLLAYPEQSTAPVFGNHTSQNLATTQELSDEFFQRQQTQCGPMPLQELFVGRDVKSIASPELFEHFPTQRGQLPQTVSGHDPMTGTRQALDGPQSEHRVAHVKDASPAEPDAQYVHDPQSGTRQVVDVAIAEHRVASPIDFKSYDLAVSLEPTASHDEQCVAHQCRFSRGSRDLTGISHDGTRRALDDPHSEHRVAHVNDFKSYNLAFSPALTASQTKEQCMARQCRAVHHQGDQTCFSLDSTRRVVDDLHSEHRVANRKDAPTTESSAHFGPDSQSGTRQALDDHNAEHRVASPCDFKTHDLAVSPRPTAFQPLEQCGTWRVIDGSYAEHRVATQSDFKSNDLAVSLEPTASLDEQCVAHQCRFSRGSRDPTGISHDGTRRALNDPHSEHRVAIDNDFKSYTLASSPAPTAFRTNEQCMAHQCRAVLHQGDQTCFSLDSAGQVHENLHSEHRVADVKDTSPAMSAAQRGHDPRHDFKSHDLAFPSEPTASCIEQCAAHRCHFSQGSRDQTSVSMDSTRQAIDDPQSEHRVAFVKDASPTESGVDSQSGTRQALDDHNAEHRDASLSDFKSHDLAVSSGPTAFTPLEQCKTLQCRFSQGSRDPMSISQDSTRQALEDPHSEHRAAIVKDALPAESAAQCRHDSQVGTRQALEDVHTEHRVANVKDAPKQSGTTLTFGPSTCELQKPLEEFQRVVAPLIAAYRRRRKPTNSQVRSAAAAILGIAKQQGITKEQCCHHLQDFSLALMTAATDLW